MQYPLAFPRTVKTERLGLNRRQSALESTWTYKSQIVHTASQWVLEWSWPQMTHVEAEAVSAWLLALQGQVGTFRYTPRQSRGSTITGKALSVESHAYNRSLWAGGWNAGAPTNLRLGQFFQLGEQLLRVVEAPAFADANGGALITFEPELRVGLAVGSPLNFTSPSTLMRLASSDAITFTLDPDRAPDFGTVSAREVV